MTVVNAAIDKGVDNFVLISTDKAVRPTNSMGASKRIAELILQAQADVQNGTKISMVRFGNVLGSSGSVVPKFKQQIEQGGPITLTDPNITRYFMTIPEAAQLVLQASAIAEGGDVFVLVTNSHKATEVPKVFTAQEEWIAWPQLQHELDTLLSIKASGDQAKLRQQLLRLAFLNHDSDQQSPVKLVKPTVTGVVNTGTQNEEPVGAEVLTADS